MDRIRRLDDVGELFGALGFDRVYEQIPADAWMGESQAERTGTKSLAFVARHEAFRVFALEARDAERAAEAGARRLAGNAERGLVCALGHSPRRVALATWRVRAGMELAVRVASFTLNPVSGSAVATFERCSPRQAETALGLAIRVGEALASEGVTRRFFTAFRATLEHLTDRIEAPRSRSDRHTLALTTLTRVLFLYFAQAKGWLDGDHQYLIRRFESAQALRRSFHKHVLDPLCFGALNRPFSERSRAARLLGRVPFLNGGLFEPTELERRYHPARWTNAAWRDAFDGLFDRFHFSVRERDGDDLIAPDMLGRVFEGVMDPDERKQSGSFYTPAALVRELVKAGLEAVLVNRFGLAPRTAERWVHDGQAPAGSSRPDLSRIMVLDPAVGSGAFLLGALEELASLRAEVRARASAVRRRVAASLYGVDLKLAAVRLTELRIWLAIIADDETADVGELAPLPNLDGQVRQGNALLDPLTIAARSGGLLGGTTRSALARLGSARRSLFALTGPAKREAQRELASEELALMTNLLARVTLRLDTRVTELLARARDRDLFGRRTGLGPDGRKELRRQRAMRRATREAARRLTAFGEKPFFAFEAHFGDILGAGGFDLVVGNPPWVRGERLPPQVRETLTHRYPSWHSAGQRGFGHLPDLSVAFVERALELTAPGGAVSFLLPAKLTSCGYAEPLRQHLVHETEIARAAPLESWSRGFAAAVYPMALVVVRAAPRSTHQVATSLGPASRASRIPQQMLTQAGPWILSPDATKTARRLRGAHPTVGDRWVPMMGVKTGADEVFLQPVPSRWTRPALRGRDLAMWRATPRLHLAWGYGPDGQLLAHPPAELWAILAPHLDRLRRRNDYRAGPPWQVFRTGLACRGHRVIWPDLARRLRAVVPSAESVPLNTVYGIATRDDDDAHALAALFNSRWISALAALVADPARGGFRRFNARVIAALPAPQGETAWARLATAGRNHGQTDDLVAELLELDQADCRALGRLAPDSL